MKITLKELRNLVADVIVEAKRKKRASKKKDELEESDCQPREFSRSAVHDFSRPLGPESRYRQQGAANWGPYTADVSEINDDTRGLRVDEEAALRTFLRGVIAEQILPEEPAVPVEETADPPPPASSFGNVWEAADRWYDFQQRGLGTPGAVKEGEHIGFAKLKRSLAHKKGVNNPGALAASIGRKKYGQKSMTAKSVAGRKK